MVFDIKNIIKTIGNPADFEEEAGADGAEYAQEVKDENNNRCNAQLTPIWSAPL